MVEQYLNDGHLLPEPLLTFKPSFAKAGQIEELVAKGILAKPLADAFRGYELFEHQLKAIQLGRAGNDFVVSSGTGSGNSLPSSTTSSCWKSHAKRGDGVIVVRTPMATREERGLPGRGGKSKLTQLR